MQFSCMILRVPAVTLCVTIPHSVQQFRCWTNHPQ